MKMSLRMKIHIIALPQETFLNARWSDDRSAATPRSPVGRRCGSLAGLSMDAVMIDTP
ncbi:hypothetical protein D3C78_969910 [compost metagenome]